MLFRDLREFLGALEKTGDLVTVREEVDWNLEASAIIRRLNEQKGPVPLFEKIKDYPQGYRLCGDHLATFRRLAIALGMSPEAGYKEILEVYTQRSEERIKPRVVSTGPCKEEITTGGDVDLFHLPAPMVHGTDGGRYLGTLNLGIFKDPDSDWVNWGIYRFMIHDRNSVGILIIPSQHSGLIYSKYEAKGESMPYAACIGVEPLVNVGATAGLPVGDSEVELIGGLREEPLPVVQCETSDLMVPATAEIVLEGEILPGVRKQEGPFGEYTGFSVSGAAPRPIFKVNAITHRKNPILTIACEGIPTVIDHVAMNISWMAEIRKDLIRAGLPVTGIYCPPESALHLLVVATKTPMAGIPFKIASAVWANKNGQYVPKVIVVNDDIDPTRMEDVIHAFATKCGPRRGIRVIEDVFNCPLTPYLEPGDRKRGRGSNVLFDCTWPLDWPEEEVPIKSSFDTIYPKELQDRVLQKWKGYGFE
jgi:4-hydroxy-3-polyprenylbenzoate decarboxylase